jgi:spore coat polysaccharide biosynthesis predicted glycosyltransferase SpsG
LIQYCNTKLEKKLAIITEGGRSFGFGHLTRCISLSKSFEEKGFRSTFYIKGDESCLDITLQKLFIFDWTENEKKLFNSIKLSTLILIDSISITNSLIKKIERLKIPIIFIDDESRRNILNKGFVIDWTVLSDKKKYFLPYKKNVTYILGSKYTPLREEIVQSKINPIRETVQEILITFGGSDIRNLTPKIVQHLSIYFPNIKKNIVIGKGYTNLDEIQKVKDKNTNFIFDVDAKEMAALMYRADIAIASGGQTLYELAKIGLPTIAILVVDNAIDDTLGWNEVGSLINIGWYNDTSLSKQLLLALKKLQNIDQRKVMQNNALEYVSSNGSQLIRDLVLEKIK